MDREQVIRMAREAGFRTGNITLSSGDPLPFVAPLSATTCIVELERFAALIEAAATEKANDRANTSWALMCEKMVKAERDACLSCYSPGDTADDWADKIRSRGSDKMNKKEGTE